MNTEMIGAVKELVDAAKRVVVVQADNPDADSLGSALALEALLSEQGKSVWLQCSVDVPGYLHHLSGWDRVSRDMPSQFDLAIVVDASTMTLLSGLEDAGLTQKLQNTPVIVLDHHAVTQNPILFADVTINEPNLSSTGELLHKLASELGWEVPLDAAQHMMSAILGDTQGLINDLTSAATYETMADLVRLGVNRPELEEARRAYSKMPESIYRYKGELLQRTELHADGRIALVIIPQQEINTYSPLYNPGPLVQPDMLQIEGVLLSVVIKHYDSGRVTGAIRANQAAPIAGALAEQLGGGGHPYASGFKIEDGQSLDDVKTSCLQIAIDLLDNPTQSEE